MGRVLGIVHKDDYPATILRMCLFVGDRREFLYNFAHSQ
jgi:hypothetical protein